MARHAEQLHAVRCVTSSIDSSAFGSGESMTCLSAERASSNLAWIVSTDTPRAAGIGMFQPVYADHEHHLLMLRIEALERLL